MGIKRLLWLFVFLLFCFLPTAAHAQATQSGVTNIKVTVSGNILSVSGYIAPFASIVLSINNTVITSTTADALGNFSFSNVAVPKATSTICFNAVDFKQLGKSQACLSVAPLNGIITRSNIFLPPTLGVQRTDVHVGDSALAFGYGMPGAVITVHVNNSSGCVVTAQPTGYYQCTIAIKQAGDYVLFADAVLKGKPSEQQLDTVLVKGLALIQATISPTTAPVGLPQFPNLFAIPWWVWLLLVLIAIILIIILIWKKNPQALPNLPAISGPSIQLPHVFDFLFKKRKLHHFWMKGVGY